jgi:hypothetical protein
MVLQEYKKKSVKFKNVQGVSVSSPIGATGKVPPKYWS